MRIFNSCQLLELQQQYTNYELILQVSYWYWWEIKRVLFPEDVCILLSLLSFCWLAPDLRRVEVSEELSLLDLLWEGECRRATGSTGSNRRSSRSHAIWTLYLTSTREGPDGTGLITTNQVHLVDLAGRSVVSLPVVPLAFPAFHNFYFIAEGTPFLLSIFTKFSPSTS
jgi:hypothetical protein